MIFGLIARNALQKSDLPLDASHIELAKKEANTLIQYLWSLIRADFRHSRSTIDLVSGCDEYLLSRLFDGFVKYTLQGSSSNPRHFHYRIPQDFFRRIKLNDGTSGDAYIYTFGDMVGFDAQLESASKIRVRSSLANKGTNNVNVKAGDSIVTSDFAIFDLNDVGKMFKRENDTAAYKISAYHSQTKIELSEKYRGVSGSNVNYAIGDIGVHACVQGFVAGVMDSEDVVLNGDSWITTAKTFNTLTALTKSDYTSGKITFEREDGSAVVGTLAPGETEIERQTVLLWPKPDGTETLSYRFYMKHPHLWLDTDRVLVPTKFHGLIQDMLEVRLREWADIKVPSTLLSMIIDQKEQFLTDASDVSLEDFIPEGARRIYGDRYYYDKDEDLA